MTTLYSIEDLPPGWTEYGRAMVEYRSPDGYVIVEGEDWGGESGETEEEVWYVYGPADANRSYPIGLADWPTLADALAAVDRHRRETAR